MSVLPTFSDLPIASPLGDLIPKQSVALGATALGLGELCGRALLHLRGNDAETVLQTPGLNIGGVAVQPDGLLARLRRDEYLLLTRIPQEAFGWLQSAIGSQRVTLTDITHGRCVLMLTGKDVREVLTKVCALDFSDAQFPNLYAAQTSLAKVRTLIIRVDVEQTPAYGLVVDRSLAAYVWDVMFDAMQEFGGMALDRESVNHLGDRSLW